MSVWRPTALAPLVVVTVLAAAACASEDDRPTSATTAPGPATAPVPATAAPRPIAHPTGADQPVIRLTEGGGIGPEGSDFSAPPVLLVLGDGTVLRPGPQVRVYPGPMLPALTAAHVDGPGLQTLLTRAQAAGLLQDPPPAYDLPPGAPEVADAPATTLELDAAGGRFVHEAYGLEPGTISTPARARLAGFVDELHDLAATVGDHLGPEVRARPERFGVIARPATPDELALSDEGPTPPVHAWPAGAGRLADSGGRCLEVPAVVGPTLAAAMANDRFTQDGTTYVVFARVLLPGESCGQFS